MDVKRRTGFDERVCRFLRVDCLPLAERALSGGSDEELLQWCFTVGRRPSDEEVLIFNAFLSKRGWRDETTRDLEQMKAARGFAHGDDIQTFFDFHKSR